MRSERDPVRTEKTNLGYGEARDLCEDEFRGEFRVDDDGGYQCDVGGWTTEGFYEDGGMEEVPFGFANRSSGKSVEVYLARRGPYVVEYDENRGDTKRSRFETFNGAMEKIKGHLLGDKIRGHLSGDR